MVNTKRKTHEAKRLCRGGGVRCVVCGVWCVVCGVWCCGVRVGGGEGRVEGGGRERGCGGGGGDSC